MVPGRKQQSSFPDHLRLLSFRPSIQLPELLQRLLETAMAATGSDAGGSLWVLGTAGLEPAVVTSTQGWALTDLTPFLKRWHENPQHPASHVLRSGRPCRLDDHLHNLERFLPAGSRSSLWVPLQTETEIIGLLQVAASQPKYYNDDYLHALHAVAAEAVTVLLRFQLRAPWARADRPMAFVGVSPAFLQLERAIRWAAACAEAPVLLRGERGSGKELAARAIHVWSARRAKPFVPVLVPALARELLADEFFGHERGAFTGAERARPGRFQAAAGGTLFLDEVGDFSNEAQAALLRVVERGEVQRVGRDEPLPVDVRIVAATNQNLEALMQQGRFRADLYDRLRMFELWVPPLRARREDIPLLADHFLRVQCQRRQRWRWFEEAGLCAGCPKADRVACATAAFFEALQTYDWPGNVRELESVICRLVVTVSREVLEAQHALEEIRRSPVEATALPSEDFRLETIIRRHIEWILQKTDYNQSEAAKFLGIPRTTLQAKMKKLGIESERKKHR